MRIPRHRHVWGGADGPRGVHSAVSHDARGDTGGAALVAVADRIVQVRDQRSCPPIVPDADSVNDR